MANTNSFSSEALRVELTGYDIREATSHAPIEGHAVSALKRCHLCRGINASSRRKKPQLVVRHKTVFFFLTVHFL